MPYKLYSTCRMYLQQDQPTFLSWEEEMCLVQKWPFEGIIWHSTTPCLLMGILQWRQEPTVMEKQDFHCHGKAGFPSQVVQFSDAHEIWHRQWLYFQRLTQSHTQQNLWRAVGSSQKQSRQKNGVEILISRLHMPSRFPTGGISVKRWTSLLVK